MSSKNNVKIVYSNKQKSAPSSTAKATLRKDLIASIAAKSAITLDSIKDEYKRTNKPWVDTSFPATMASIYSDEHSRKIEWKRPHELCPKPKLFSGGVGRFDVRQGELGDCWVLAAVASLSMHKELFDKVVVPGQNFDYDYCGAFLFRLWQFGKWVDVLVDDQLPVEDNQLIFMQSVDSDEFWSALLEKAYAKVNNSYEALIGGAQAEAMEDFTGGLCETLDITDEETSRDLFKNMLKYNSMSSLMGCSIDAGDDEIEGELGNGLIIGHAYTVTEVKKIEHKGSTHRLLRIRNPWGDDCEWNGAFSDGSKEWNAFSEDDRRSLGITFDDDGEFWMPIDDFIANFTKLEVCHLGPESLDNPEMKSKRKKIRWEMTLLTSEWQKNVNAGGCRNFIETFWTNPQFVVNVVDPDEDDDEDMGVIILGLMQKDMRKKKLDFWTIGYSIYEVPNSHSGLLPKKYFQTHKMSAKSPQYINQREITGRHKLPPGKYVIVPTTYQANEEGELIMRIFSQQAFESNEMEDKDEMTEPKILTSPEQKALDAKLASKIETTFNEITGPKGLLTASKLKKIFDAAIGPEIPNFKGFNAEVCRSLVALKDLDLSGRLEFDEFMDLWKHVSLWKRIFIEYDTDKGGSFDAYELRTALSAAGFKVNNKLFQVLANRYTDADYGSVDFDDFILLVCRLKNAFENFKAQPKNHEGKGLFGQQEYLNLALYV